MGSYEEALNSLERSLQQASLASYNAYEDTGLQLEDLELATVDPMEPPLNIEDEPQETQNSGASFEFEDYCGTMPDIDDEPEENPVTEGLTQLVNDLRQGGNPFGGPAKEEGPPESFDSRYTNQGPVSQWPDVAAIYQALVGAQKTGNDQLIHLSNGERIVTRKFPSQGLVYIDVGGVRYVEQNPTKNSSGATRVRQGHRIFWVIRLQDNQYRGYLMDGYVFH